MDDEIKNLIGVDPNKNLINIFTDGSHCYQHKGTKIGYSFVVEYDENVAHIQNGKLTIGKTKKKLGALYAETIAVLKALEYILAKQLNHVVIYTDSMYLYKALKDENRQLNSVLSAFVNKTKILLLKLKYRNLHVDFKYVKGHSNIEGNHIADILAKNGRKGKSAKMPDLADMQNILQIY